MSEKDKLIIIIVLLAVLVLAVILVEKGQEHSKQENKYVDWALSALSYADNNTKAQLYPNTNWLPVTPDIKNNIYAIDLNSVLQSTNETKTFWVEIVTSEEYRQEQSLEQSSTPISYKIDELYEVYCKDLSSVESLSVITYNNEGEINSREDWADSEVIPPDSALSYAINLACLPNEEIKDIAEKFKEDSK